jgi:HlyD family secretion protein
MLNLRRRASLLVAVLVVAGSAVALLTWAAAFRSGAEPPPPAETADAPAVACLGCVDVEGGVAALDALRPGRVEAVHVKENERVAAGAVLVRLEDRLARERLAEARAALELARLALEQVRRRPQEHRLRLAQQVAAVKAAGQRLAAARQTYASRRSLVERKLEAPERLAEAQARVEELEALAEAEADRLDELTLHDPDQEVRRAEAELRLQGTRVGQAEAELKELTLTAPGPGTVLRILAGPGDLVGGPGHKPVIYFCPEGPRLVRVEVEQEFAGLIRPGQPAAVRDDSSEGASWQGKVRRVADWFGPHRVVLEEPRPEREVRTVECVIAIDGACPLRIGQRVRVRIGVGPAGPE